MRVHADELHVTDRLVRDLLRDQLPSLAGLDVAPLSSQGSSNALFRLGPDLLVRLPRQPGGSATVHKEARWGPYVGARLPVPVPEVVAVGGPGRGYPESWSVVRWLEGSTPATGSGDAAASPAGLRALALDLAGLVRALRSVDVPAEAHGDPALRWYRAEPLADRAQDTRADLLSCRQFGVDVDALLLVWEEAMRLPAVVGPTQWLHGDLLGENLLVTGGRLAAVLDLGGLAVGDPTVDLVVAWDVLDSRGREVFREAVEVDDDTWLRGRAWALCLSAMTLPYYWTTMPERCAGRVRVLEAVLLDARRTG